MSDESKIEQLQKAVEQEPNDELAQFSLANALLDAGRPEDAAPCLQRVLAINGRNSKAYELLGRAQKQTGLSDLAIQTLTNGYRIAQRNGDMLPMQAMEALLTELGAPVPKIVEQTANATASTAGGGEFSCRRCGGHGPALEKQPFKGDLGQTVLDSICDACWKEWVAMGTKVINELRLPMYDPQAQEQYDRHMKEFLVIE